MAKRKKYNVSGQVCIYCGKILSASELQKEDVVPRGLFPKDYATPPKIIVPSCSSCNQGLSNDEEFFRNLIASLLSDKSKIADSVYQSRVVSAFTKKSVLAERISNQIENVLIATLKGILTGEVAGLYHFTKLRPECPAACGVG